MKNRSAQLGWNPDRPDKRDRKFTPTAAPDAPQTPDWSEKMPAVFNQEQAGACTGYAFKSQVVFNRLAQGEPADAPSARFAYYVARAREGTTDSDDGAQIRDIIAGAISDGICSESVWQDFTDEASITQEPDAASYQRAAFCEVMDYERVDHTRESDLVAALFDGPLIMGVSIYESFMSSAVARTGMAPMPGPNEATVGGHALWLCQIDMAGRLGKIRNSWGAGWGVNGYGWFPMEYLTDPDLADDFWRVKRIT
jgi:hypothetical protein